MGSQRARTGWAQPRTGTSLGRVPAQRRGGQVGAGARALPARRPGKGPGQSYLAQHPHAPLMWLWRHRWPLAPVAVTAGAVTGAVCAPVPAVLAFAAGGAAAWAAAWAGPRLTVRGRMGLSVRERRTAALGLAAASGWVALVDVIALPGRVDAALLAAALGVPAQRWWTSRRKPAAKLTPTAAAMLDKWAAAVAGPAGPKQLRGSIPVRASISEPVEGALVMVVQLAGVHAADATSTRLRRDVEVALGLPADTVRLTAIRDEGSSDRLQVTMTPSRHLEAAPTAWPGPVLEADGAIPTALDSAAEVVSVHLHNEDGVEHGLISGTSGMGKGGSTVVVITPSAIKGIDVVLYADGKRGMSAPELEPVVDKMGVDEAQWGLLIDIAHAVMCDREQRYGKAKLKRFVVGQMPDDDPVVTLLLDEATTINGALSTKRLRKVAEIAQRGRATGVRLIQVSQSVRSDMIVGGVPTRDLLTGAGFSIAHKPGGASAARLATDGIPVPGLVEALQSLPPEAGMAVISRRGQVLATQARVFDAEEDAIAAIAAWRAAGGRPRQLTGADLAAGGPAYATWNSDHGGPDAPSWGTPSASADSSTSTPAAADAGGRPDAAGDWILEALDEHGPSSVNQLQALDGVPARATLYRALNRLMAEALLTNTSGVWRLVGAPEGGQNDDEDDEVAADDETARELEDEK